MRQAVRQSQSAAHGGFAIVVVLASLMVLTTLFAIASQRSIAHLQGQNAEQHLAMRQTDSRAILTMLMDFDATTLASGDFALPGHLANAQVRVQDVGGLIDLNTAAPELLGRLFKALDFPADAAANLRDWQKEGQRLLRVDDVIRITGAKPELLEQLLQVTTVYSGRRGISAEVAPEGVNLIAGSGYETPASHTNFAIYRSESGVENLIGVISVVGSKEQNRVLELR